MPFPIAPLVALLLAPPGADPPELVLRGLTVVDVETGTLRPGLDVEVRGGRISAVGPRLAASPGADVVVAHGLYAVPAFFDMHVHLARARDSALPALVANGVLTVRDMGGVLEEIDRWRGAVECGARVGPRIVRAGPTLNGRENASHHLAVTTDAEARAAVRTLKKVGVDFVKIHNALERGPLAALLEEARAQSLRVVGHVPKAVTPEEAVELGLSGIEHTETLFEGPFAAAHPGKAILDAIPAWIEGGAARLLARRLAAAGATFEPALVAYRSGFEGPEPALEAYLARSVRQQPASEPPRSSEVREARRRLLASFSRIVRIFHEEGVPLLAGTDLAGAGVYPGFSLHTELELLVESGLSPAAALRAATLEPARALALDGRLGAIAPGFEADLVLLDGSPLVDIRATRGVRAVIVRGRYLDRGALDALLAEARALAQER